MKHKLNMLEPAIKIFRVIFVFSVFSVILYVCKYMELAILFLGIILFLSLIIIIGVAIELKQDNYLVNRHYQLRNEAKRLGKCYECEYCGARFVEKSSFCPICGKTLKT